MPRGFVPINLFIHPFIYVFIGAFNLMDNWVKSVEREDFIKVEEESYNTLILIIPRPHRGAEFIIKKS